MLYEVITVIDAQRRKVQIGDRPIELTAKEFDLLLHFARHPGRVYSRAQLLDLVWGYGHDGYEHTVNSHINRLRAKIERNPARPRYLLRITSYNVCYTKLLRGNEVRCPSSRETNPANFQLCWQCGTAL